MDAHWPAGGLCTCGRRGQGASHSGEVEGARRLRQAVQELFPRLLARFLDGFRWFWALFSMLFLRLLMFFDGLPPLSMHFRSFPRPRGHRAAPVPPAEGLREEQRPQSGRGAAQGPATGHGKGLRHGDGRGGTLWQPVGRGTLVSGGKRAGLAVPRGFKRGV